MIKAPPRIAEAARARVKAAKDQIRNSVAAINNGRPGDAEYETSRREQVYQIRTGKTLEEAKRRVAKGDEGQERIFGDTVDFVDVAFFERGRRAARSVARIVTRDGAALGTGFLISPRLLITNNHVIGDAASSGDLLAEFDYERDIKGIPLKTTRFAFAPKLCFLTNHQNDLDYTVIALGERIAGEKLLTQFGYLPISNARNKHQLGDYVNIIQHPDGRPKEAVLRENQLVARVGTTLHYIADTEPGSSGSPVLNVQFALVALHHWGTPHRELTDEKGKAIPKTVNEGIRASSIYGDLTTLRSSMAAGPSAFIDEVLQIGLESSAPAEVTADPESDPHPGRTFGRGTSVQMAEDGTATWNIPLTVSVRVGDRPASSATATANGPGIVRKDVSASAGTNGGSEAKLELDPDYRHRPGYDPKFLGIPVPLPELSRSLRSIAAKNKTARRGENEFELKYHHYSVLMNGRRRLAFVSAVNINGAEAKDYNRDKGIITDPFEDDSEGQEASELWFIDPRIDEDEQTPRNFYQGQTAFDAQGDPIVDKKKGGQHVNRMFQQGHLTRRQDPIWGNDEQQIRFANADTFHVTNCAPQVGFFNMGIAKRASESLDAEAKTKSAKNGKAKKSKHPGGNLYWRALEEYVLTNARADRQRVSVFTGPIFDDGDQAWDRGRPDMKGFKAPGEFWKLILRVEDDALLATALIADQSPLIDYFPEALMRGEAITRVTYDKIVQYHVSIAELESRTGLDFGKAVQDADTFSGRGRMREVKTIGDVSLTRKPKLSAKRKLKASRKVRRGR